MASVVPCGRFVFAWDGRSLLALGAQSLERGERLADWVTRAAQVEPLPCRVIPFPWQQSNHHNTGAPAMCSVALSSFREQRRTHGDNLTGEMLLVAYADHVTQVTFIAGLDPFTFRWSNFFSSNSDSIGAPLSFPIACEEICIIPTIGNGVCEQVVVAGFDVSSHQRVLTFWTISRGSQGDCSSPSPGGVLRTCGSFVVESRTDLCGVKSPSVQLLMVGPGEFVAVVGHWQVFIVRLGDPCENRPGVFAKLNLATQVQVELGPSKAWCLLQRDPSAEVGGRLLCLAQCRSAPSEGIIKHGILHLPRPALATAADGFVVLASADLTMMPSVRIALACGTSETIRLDHHIARCTDDTTGFDDAAYDGLGSLVGWSTEGESLTQLHEHSRRHGGRSSLHLRSCALPPKGHVPYRDRPRCVFSEVVLAKDTQGKRKQHTHSASGAGAVSALKTYLAEAARVYNPPRSTEIVPAHDPPAVDSGPQVVDTSWSSSAALLPRPSSSQSQIKHPPDWALHRGSMTTQFAVRPISAPPPPSSAARRKLVTALLQDQWLVTKTRNHMTDVAFAGVLGSTAEALARSKPKHSRPVGSAPATRAMRRGSVHSSPTRAPLTKLSEQGRAHAPAVIAVPLDEEDGGVSSLRTIVYYPAAVSRQRNVALDKYEELLENALETLVE